MRAGVVRAVARQMQEQQLKARQLVLQQQAASAVAAASKTQREVRGPCSGSLQSRQVCQGFGRGVLPYK
jgi:hypothetical protein